MAHYKAVFISDVHLGTVNSQSKQLLKFLKNNTFDQLYIVGDFIDMIQMKKRLYLKKSHFKVIQKILSISKKCEVFYIYGNHDAFMEVLIDEHVSEISVKKEVFYTSSEGKKYLVVHGDEFDGVVTKMKWLYWLGDNAYSFALFLNRWVNRLRKLFGLKYWSLSQFLKAQVKGAIQFVNNFEQLVINKARKESCDGVICGHIHVHADKDCDGVHYLNTGCWTEYCSAVVDDDEGIRVIILESESQ